MAVIYRRSIQGVHYEVRTAGQSIRLYTNGAFHSQYNPRHLFTGAVWDLLILPALFRAAPPRRVLVLGVGGGTVIHQLNRLYEPEHITGIELDPQHLKIARRFFKVRYSNTTLVQADALDWLQAGSEQFDYIIDDVFQHAEGDPVRPFPADPSWYRMLRRHLAAGGVIVQNHIGRREAMTQRQHLPRETRIIGFETAQYENCVLGIYDASQTTRQLLELGKHNIAGLEKSQRRRLRVNYWRVSGQGERLASGSPPAGEP
ncbi:MAG: methyltransferase domain-containing protein [Proteobacteria bacterium]|nr:methyltransferase domain-containing protein [Pseudomonadota bacterium]